MYHLKEGPLDTHAFHRMMSSLEHRGPDGSHVFTGDCIALGHQRFVMTKESFDEIQPLHRAESDIAVTGDIRLDNREDLLPWFGFQDSGEKIPDSLIVLHAYEKWGIGMVDRLRGHYAFALWDGRDKTLYLVTDHTGARSLYYHKSDHVFLFATEIKGIHGSGLVPRTLDKEHLAVHLTLPLSMLVRPEKTFFAGVQAMCAAHVLKVTRTSCSETHYWVPDIRKRLNVRHENEWREAFQELFFPIVNANLRSAYPVAALLSGGLDSSSIVATAAALLKKRGERLITLSSVASERWAGHVTDERFFIDQFKSFDMIDMHYVDDDSTGPFSGIDGWNDDSPLRTSRHYLYSAFCDMAKSLGARVILEGAMGEHGPSFHGAGCLADSFRKGNWFYVIREMLGLWRMEDRPLSGLIKSHLVRPWIPINMQSRSGISDPVLHPGIRKEFIETWAAQDLIRDCRQDLASFFADRIDHRKNQAAVFLRKKACIPRNSSAGYNGVEFRYPFMNPDLIEFCLATPEHFKIRNGYRRYMIRCGMEGILPSAIQFRTSKEPFSPDYHFRFIQQAETAKNILSEITHNESIHEIVNVKEVESMLDTLLESRHAMTNRGLPTLFDIPMMIYLICFLKKSMR